MKMLKIDKNTYINMDNVKHIHFDHIINSRILVTYMNEDVETIYDVNSEDTEIAQEIINNHRLVI